MYVLVVGEDLSGADALARNLRRNGYDVRKVGTGTAALGAYGPADVVLLDLELPDIDGLEVCRAIRADSDIPIITLTRHRDELHRVLSLQAGSDDCLIKPYGFRELMARIDAVMRRAHPRPAAGAETVGHGPLRLNPRSREALLDGRPLDLTRKEFDLLHLLLSQPETVVSRQQIMAKVWGHLWTTSSRTLDMHVSSLRKKLGAGSWIITVRGVGFRLGYPWPTTEAVPS